MALDDMFDCLKTKLIGHLKETQQHCCVAFDMWTDNYRRISYMTYTCHYVTDSWKLMSRVLKTAMFEHPHTSIRIEENFNAMMDEYGLRDKEIIAVVDGAANVNRTVNDMGFVKIKCIAHSINRLIQFDLIQKGEGIEDLKNIIKKLRLIQKALLYSYGQLTKMAKNERQKQIFELLEELTAIEEAIEADERFSVEDLTAAPAGMDGLKSISSVRWNCIYKVCHAHFHNSAIVKKCLEHHAAYELILSRSELALLGRIVEVLEVFNTFTKYVQGNSYPTLNSLILFYVEIKGNLEQIQRENMCEVINKVVNILLKNLDHRFQLTDACIAAAILDPSSQHLPLIQSWLRDKDLSREDLLHRMVDQLKIKLPSASDPHDESEHPPDNVQSRHMSLREKLLSRHVPIHRAGLDNSIEGELLRFQDIREIFDDVLDFWKKFADNYPNLAAIAKVLFSIQATTATAESSFSFAGSVIRSRRATIDPYRVEKVLFIHDNYDLFQL
ncbi:uncharacterized protein LOC129571046 [Sitodiplosis mosellana]|uniref:uncharacterized protein LOC129571046 n=1 Tax=Sitodiplosis mosellana TaxID=263140 RepID=UPI002443C39A|nr:uncharacterized protein LOC129571046 [Sitodiplosis mosellana]XP_055306785.1 uncharacterized protein LOC129571046 [Sitodiplosis mosellana]